MKYFILFAFLLYGNIMMAQGGGQPTIEVCGGGQYACITSAQFQLCVNINVEAAYPNISIIDKFEIDWGDNTPITTVPGSTNPPSTNHTYNLAGFFGTCTATKEFTIKLLTKHTGGVDPANSAFFIIFRNPPIAGISVTNDFLCSGQSTTISDASCPAGFTEPTWDFGDGTSLNNGSLFNTHIYNTPGTYTIKHSVKNSCGTDFENKTITVITPPSADVKVDSGAITGTPPVVCLGGGGLVKLDGTISLEESSYMWTVSPSSGWSWWPLPSPIPTTGKPRIKFTTAGTYTIKLKVNNACNLPSEKSIEIKVVNAPLLSISQQPDACQSISYTPSPLTPNAIYKINGVVQSTFPVNLNVAATPYIITATLTNECGTQTASDEFSIATPQDVNITTPSADLIVCTGSAAITLIASPAGGMWQGSNISQVGANSVFTPPNSPGVFNLKYVRGTGTCLRMDEVKITVEQSYSLNLTPQMDGCNSLSYKPAPFDMNVAYTINGVAQTQWPTNLAVSPNPYITIGSVTNACGTKTIADTFLVVSPLTVDITTPSDTLCKGTSTIALNANPPGGTWTGSNISGPNGSKVFTPSTVGTFALIYARGSGTCERRDTVKMIVVDAYNLQLTQQHDECISLNYTPIPNDPNVKYTIDGVIQTQFPISLGVSATPHIVSAAYTNECGAKILTDSFVVSSPTAVSIATPISDTSVCQNSGNIPLSASPAGGTWLGQNIANSIFSPSSGGDFLLIYTRGSGNCEKRDSVKIKVISTNIMLGNDLSKCLLDDSFTLSGVTPATGTWSGPGLSGVANQFSPFLSGIGTHSLAYDVTDPTIGCKFSDTLHIVVNPMPSSAFAPPSQTCTGQEIQFENQSQSTYNMAWNFGDGSTSTSENPTHTYASIGTYTIKLQTTTEFGCMDMASQTVFVTEPPTAQYSLMPDSGCAVLNIQFMNASSGYETTYNWDFGNGQTSTEYDPGEISFVGGNDDKTYYITLSATNLCATKTWTDSILVHPLPVVIFGTSTDTVCSAAIISFSNISVGNPENFYWDFGDGHTSTDSLPDPLQYFTDTLFRTYTIRLISTNFCGVDTAEHDIVVKPVNVRAFFNLPNNTGCEPYSVQLSNFSTPGTDIFWDFGDGNTSAEFNPIHTFQSDGIFKIVQKASDGCGYDSTISFVTVLPAPQVSFTSESQICKLDTLKFTNTSQLLSGTIWDFGDGDSSLLYNPSHFFQNSGQATITLTGISAENNCPAKFTKNVQVLALPIPAFEPSQPDGCLPLTLTFQNQSMGATYFEWDFGDGNTQLGATPTHVFDSVGKFAVRLRGIDLNGCRQDSVLRYITVHPIPTPIFSIQRDILCGLPVSIDCSNQTLDAVGYVWNFGDAGSSSILNSPTHMYEQPGDFNIVLEATNTFGCKDTSTQIFSAYAQPIADFTPTPTEGCDPLNVVFTNFSTNTTSADWFFSDGGISDTLDQTTHLFEGPGLYGATLVVSHRDVCFDTLFLEKIITVKPSPTANFTFLEKETDPPSGMFEFTDQSINAEKWLWNFGDGTSSTQQNPQHRYFSNGPKNVILTVYSNNGCSDDTTIVVTPEFMIGLFVPNAMTPSLGNGQAAVFQPSGVGLKEYEIVMYSSYGQLLWQSNALLDGQPAEYWDGTFKGNLLPQDVYTWEVKKAIFLDGTPWTGKKVGSLTLIR
jgi:large repetitive protein